MGDDVNNALGMFECISQMVVEALKEERGVMWVKRRQEFLTEKGDTGMGLWEVIEEFKDVFKETPGKAKNYECVLNMKDHELFIQKGYPVPYSKRITVERELKVMLDREIIEKSTLPYLLKRYKEMTQD